MRKFNSEACVDTTHDVLYTHEVCVVADRHFYVHKHKKNSIWITILFDYHFTIPGLQKFPLRKWAI